MKNTLYKIYHDPAHSAGLGGVNKLRIAAGEATGVTPPLLQVTRYLEGDDTYTLHKTVRIHFPRNRLLVNDSFKPTWLICLNIQQIMIM